jgi:peptidyl-prolyl cis-trans isomerase D
LVLKEVNQLNEVGVDNGSGLESFKNTKNDSMFVTINSDIPYNPNYFTKSQIPEGLKDKVTTASVGQIVGPIKEQGYYIVAKLLDKRNMPSDSVKSSHILFAYKGAERSTSNRTKEEAKALADKTLAEIKANPAKFNEDLKLSDEPGAEKEEEV